MEHEHSILYGPVNALWHRLGFAWARPDWGHGAVCLYAAALFVYSLRGIFSLKLIYPAQWRDVVVTMKE